MENWKAAVSHPGRRMSFQCIEHFDDILRLRCANEIVLVVDNDFIDKIPEIVASGFLDDAVTIRWNGAVFSDAVMTLFAALSEKKLRTVLFQSYHEASKAFAEALAERLPEVKVVSWVLNKAKRGE